MNWQASLSGKFAFNLPVLLCLPIFYIFTEGIFSQYTVHITLQSGRFYSASIVWNLPGIVRRNPLKISLYFNWELFSFLSESVLSYKICFLGEESFPRHYQSVWQIKYLLKFGWIRSTNERILEFPLWNSPSLSNCSSPPSPPRFRSSLLSPVSPACSLLLWCSVSLRMGIDRFRPK